MLFAVACVFIFILIPSYVHFVSVKVPGAYDALYLSEYSPYDTIVVEIDYQPGMAPDHEAVDSLKRQIEQYSDKKVEICINEDIEKNEVTSNVFGDDIFSVASELQKSHRNKSTGWLGGNITLYIMYLDTVWHSEGVVYSKGGSSENAATTRVLSVGVTYAADSFIIFRDALMDPNMESTILLHETGHVWGLEHSEEPDNVMNAEFTVIKNTAGNTSMSQFPADYSLSDKDKLARLHRSPHILPIF